MTGYDIKLNADKLVGLLSNKEGFSALLEDVLNQILEAQMTDHLGAERYEHSGERQGYRNGTRVRQLSTRIGTLTLRVPQTRDGSFSTEIFNRYQRSEQAFVTTIMEMYLQGVSTRKVSKITEELCGAEFSKSTVSQLCVGLDARIAAWKERRLDGKRYPFVIVDAMVIDVRRDHQVRSTGSLIAYGVNGEGAREVLGLWLADSETESSWEEVFKDLKSRGLREVDLVVSDAHKGLVTALKRQFQGAQWQRCQTHFMRNILGVTPKHHRKEVAMRLKLVFAASDKQLATQLARELLELFETRAEKAMSVLEGGLENALSVLTLPERYRRRLRTTNLAERMNEEIRRREKVVRIFPNEAAAERLIGAILAEKHEEWLSGRRYLDMAEYWELKEEKKEASETPSTGKVISMS